MALSSDHKKQFQHITEELEERLNALEKLIDRTKVMYEQYFMGIQRVAPMQLHRDVERKIRELTQIQIRNTALRFRFTTLSQKFGSYNTYWKRTMREIEQGRYIRDLTRVRRKAQMSGEELPEELLANLPKLMQDRIRRDRDRISKRTMDDKSDSRGSSEQTPGQVGDRPGVFRIDESDADTLFSDGDLDMDQLFGSLTSDDADSMPAQTPSAAKQSARPDTAGPPPLAPPPRPGPGPKPAASPIPRSYKASKPPPVPPLRPAGQSPVAPPPLGKVGKGSVTPPPLKPAAATPPPPGMTERQCREIHARYQKAREMVGDKSPVQYDKLVQSLHKQAPQIMKQHNARSVDFQVVVRGDKVVLKAKPIK